MAQLWEEAREERERAARGSMVEESIEKEKWKWRDEGRRRRRGEGKAERMPVFCWCRHRGREGRKEHSDYHSTVESDVCRTACHSHGLTGCVAPVELELLSTPFGMTSKRVRGWPAFRRLCAM